MKNYVKTHKGLYVPDGAAHYNAENGCFYNKDKTRIAHSVHDVGEWFDITVPSDALAAIELPLQDLPNWDEAPEWADRLMHTPVCIDYWCNDSKFKEVADITNYGSFGVTTGLMLSDMTLIEMRPIAIEDKEWLPTINNRCIHIYGGGVATRHEEEVFIVGIDKLGNYVFQNDGSECYYSDPASEFRPLKTAEELEREAFIEDGLNIVMKLKSLINPNEGVLSLALYGLFDAGFTAPKGEG